MSFENIDPIIRIAAFVVGAACLLSPAFVFLKAHALSLTAMAIVFPGTILCSAGVWSSITIEMPGGYKTQLAELKNEVAAAKDEVVLMSNQLSELRSKNQFASAVESDQFRKDIIKNISGASAAIFADEKTPADTKIWMNNEKALFAQGPFIEFQKYGEDVEALLSGSVKSVEKNEALGTYSVTIEDKIGLNETVSNLSRTSLSVGDKVSTDQYIGDAVPLNSASKTMRLVKPAS